MPGPRLRSKSPAQEWWSISAIRSSNRTSAASARCGDASPTSRSLVTLAALRAIKHHPHRQVVGEVLESVTRARLREQHVVGAETVAPLLAPFSGRFPYDKPAFA